MTYPTLPKGSKLFDCLCLECGSLYQRLYKALPQQLRCDACRKQSQKAKKREYAVFNAEKLRALNIAWHKNPDNLTRKNAGIRAWRREHPIRYLLGAALKRQFEKDGTRPATGEEDVFVLRDPKGDIVCSYCLQICAQVGGGPQVPNSVTIDRIDSRLGYVVGNVAVACFECNRRKSDLSVGAMRRLADCVDAVRAEMS